VGHTVAVVAIARLVKYTSQVFTKNLQYKHCQQCDSMIADKLLQAQGLVKAFTAMLSSFQMNYLLSAKICHLTPSLEAQQHITS